MVRQLLRFTVMQLCCLAPMSLHAADHKDEQASPDLEIQIIFDNTSAREDLRRGWGFSALIDFRGHRILFDSGSDPILLLEHFELMKHVPPGFDVQVGLVPEIVIHGGHVGPGLFADICHLGCAVPFLGKYFTGRIQQLLAGFFSILSFCHGRGPYFCL